MISKLQDKALMAYILVKGFISDFKKNEQGMEIVQVVLLILVGVLAIVAIWGALSGWLQELWTKITTGTDSGLQSTTIS
ncbi:MAG: hypothetical protein LBM98_00360 [Oscillospiraceae bacterium]|jgi:Flp pilus assembly pilin Flp|nr:hypothetical protein [Oscillospiraceae bacterium]